MRKFEVVMHVRFHVDADDVGHARELARQRTSGMRTPTVQSMHENVVDVRVPGGDSLVHGSGHVERLAAYLEEVSP